MFELVNCYGALVYIAFFKKNLDGCLGKDSEGFTEISPHHSCFNELGNQLTLILCVNICKNAIEVHFSRLNYCRLESHFLKSCLGNSRKEILYLGKLKRNQILKS